MYYWLNKWNSELKYTAKPFQHIKAVRMWYHDIGTDPNQHTKLHFVDQANKKLFRRVLFRKTFCGFISTPEQPCTNFSSYQVDYRINFKIRICFETQIIACKKRFPLLFMISLWCCADFFSLLSSKFTIKIQVEA